MHGIFQEDIDTAVRAAPAIPIRSAAGTWSILKYSEPGYWVRGHADPLLPCPVSPTMWMPPLVQFVVQQPKMSWPRRHSKY